MKPATTLAISILALGFFVPANSTGQPAAPSADRARQGNPRWQQRLDKDGDGKLSQAERQEGRRLLQESRRQRPESQPDGAAPTAANVTRDIEYARAGDKALLLDLYLPPDADAIKPMPVVIWIHGGGWRAGNKNNCPFAGMTGRGYAVVSINYRLTDVAAFPAQIHDCKAAVRWVRAHTEQYGFAPDRIGVAGGSAGGHLVALLGTSGDMKELEGEVGGNPKQSSRVQAVVDFCGPALFVGPDADLGSSGPAGREPQAVIQLLGGPISENPDKARLASPAAHVSKDDPPFLIVHGDQDRLVPLGQARVLAEALEKAHVPVTLHVLKGVGHSVMTDDTIQLAVRFLDEHLKRTTTAPAKN